MLSLLLSFVVTPSLALHEIFDASFIIPKNNTFVAEHTDKYPRLDFDELNAPVLIDLNAIPNSVAELYEAAGVQFLTVVYDQQVPRSPLTETADFAPSKRLAACPRRLNTLSDDELADVRPAGPRLAAAGLEIGQFAAGVDSDGYSGFNIKFVESARQLAFTIEDETNVESILVRTYLTSTDEEGNELRVLQEELEVPTSCAQDPDDERACARNGRTDGQMTVCVQADASCFDEVELLVQSRDDRADSGFCVDDIMLGAIQHGRRYSLVTGDDGERTECGRAATLAPGGTITGRFISITSAADAEWESVSLNHASVSDTGFLNPDEQVVTTIRFGELGDDFSNPDRVALQEGKKAFRYWPNPAARDTFFEVTAFWLSDGNPVPAEIDGGGHWHPSSLCEPGCGGRGYEKHHAHSASDRQGFTIEFIVNGTMASLDGLDVYDLVDDDNHAIFQLAYFDYRNVGGHPDESDTPLLRGHPEAPEHDAGYGSDLGPWYAPLEVCTGPDVAHDFSTLAEWNACPDLRRFGENSYLPASHLVPANVSSIDSLGCCGRIVFGCAFLGSDPATVHACLWYEIVGEANATRHSIWDSFYQLGADVGAETDQLILDIQAQGQLVRDDIAEWAANTTAILNGEANDTRMFIWNEFELLADTLANVSASAQQNITRDANSTLYEIWRQANLTRENFLPKAEMVLDLINKSRHGLINETIIVNLAVPIINKATADTYENIRLLLELIDLLDNLPSDIDAHTMLVVEIAEKEVLIHLLQLKARLASQDGALKNALDEIRACLTLQRIKLEKTLDFARRLSSTSSKSSS